MVAIIEKRDLRDFDWLTTLLAIAIAVFRDLADPQCSADRKLLVETDHRDLASRWSRFVVVAFSDYRRIIDAAPFFYVVGLVLLFLVLTPLGVEVNGQKAWLKLPLIGQFQPSEFVKIPTVLMLAKYFGGRKGGALDA